MIRQYLPELMIAKAIVDGKKRHARAGGSKERGGIGRTVDVEVDKAGCAGSIDEPRATFAERLQLASALAVTAAANDDSVTKAIGRHVEQHRQIQIRSLLAQQSAARTRRRASVGSSARAIPAVAQSCRTPRYILASRIPYSGSSRQGRLDRQDSPGGAEEGGPGPEGASDVQG